MSKSLMLAPKRTEKSETSNEVRGATPLLPARILSQVSFTFKPTGVTTPRPVITTRRFDIRISFRKNLKYYKQDSRLVCDHTRRL